MAMINVFFISYKLRNQCHIFDFGKQDLWFCLNLRDVVALAVDLAFYIWFQCFSNVVFNVVWTTWCSFFIISDCLFIFGTCTISLTLLRGFDFNQEK